MSGSSTVHRYILYPTNQDDPQEVPLSDLVSGFVNSIADTFSDTLNSLVLESMHPFCMSLDFRQAASG